MFKNKRKLNAGGPADRWLGASPEFTEQWRVQFTATNNDLKDQIEALKIKLSSEEKKHVKTTTLLGDEKLLKNGLEVNNDETPERTLCL